MGLPTPHTFTFRTQADAALIDWALARFERADLELPPLAIAFSDPKEPCDGNYGFYRSGTPARIDICALTWNEFSMAPKRTVLHELGHAWGQHNLTEQLRQQFLRFRGLEIWWDEKTPWEEQGSEHAAEVIAWALMDRELEIVTVRDADRETLAQAFELLTGSIPPSWGRSPLPTRPRESIRQ